MLSVSQESFPTIGRNNWLGSLSDLRAQRPDLSERIMSVKLGVRLKVVSLELSENQLTLEQFQEPERLILA